MKVVGIRIAFALGRDIDYWKEIKFIVTAWSTR